MVQEIAAYTQILTTIGIFLSLIFVGVEVHQNTIETKYQNFLAATQRTTDFRARSMDRATLSVVHKGREDIDQLDAIEKEIFIKHLMLTQQAAMALNALRGRGLTDAASTNRVAKQLIQSEWDHPGPRKWWEGVRADPPMPINVAEFIDEALASPN